MIAFCESYYLLFTEVTDALWVSNGFTSAFLSISKVTNSAVTTIFGGKILILFTVPFV